MLIIPMWLEFIFHESLGFGEHRHRFFYAPTTNTWWQQRTEPAPLIFQPTTTPLPKINDFRDVNKAIPILRTMLEKNVRWEDDMPNIFYETTAYHPNGVSWIRQKWDHDITTDPPWTSCWRPVSKEPPPTKYVICRSRFTPNHVFVEGLGRRDNGDIIWRRIVGYKNPTIETFPYFDFTMSAWWLYSKTTNKPPKQHPTNFSFERCLRQDETTSDFAPIPEQLRVATNILSNPLKGCNPEQLPFS